MTADAAAGMGGARAAFSELKKHRGLLLNISATLHYLGTPYQLHVSAAKAGVDALTRNLAVEWGRYGIRVNAIAPGPLVSPMTDDLATPEWVANKLRSQILPRLGTVDEVAATAVFLASDAASLYLGQTLSPNAGGVM